METVLGDTPLGLHSSSFLAAILWLQSLFVCGAGLAVASLMRTALLRSDVLRLTIMAALIGPMFGAVIATTGPDIDWLSLRWLAQVEEPLSDERPSASFGAMVSGSALGAERSQNIGAGESDEGGGSAHRSAGRTGTGAESRWGYWGFLVRVPYALVLLWAGIALLFLARLVYSYSWLAWVCCTAGSAPDEWQAMARSLATRMRVRTPALLVSPRINSPCLTGIQRPVIFLPPSEGTDPQSLPECVLIHEMAHIARRDCFWGLLARVVQVLLWPQPAVWALVRRLEEASDEVADDFVIQAGVDPAHYVRQLLHVARRCQVHYPIRMVSIGIVAFRSALGRRTQRVLASGPATSTIVSMRLRLVMLSVAALGAIFAGFVGASAASTSGNPAKESQAVANASVSEWETRATFSGAGHTMGGVNLGGDEEVIISEPLVSGHDTRFVVSDTVVNTDSRVVAIAGDGSVHVGSGDAVLTPGRKIRLATLTFSGLLPEDIRQIQFQTKRTPASVTLLGGHLAGQNLSVAQWQVLVHPGQVVEGEVSYTTFNPMHAGAVAPLGYTWTWGDRRASIESMDGWIPTGNAQWTSKVRLIAPSEPGTYYILFSFNGEFTIEDVMSSTNWTCGNGTRGSAIATPHWESVENNLSKYVDEQSVAARPSSGSAEPIWDDGNDVWDVTEPYVKFAHEHGYVHGWPYTFKDGIRCVDIPLMPIRVVVQ